METQRTEGCERGSLSPGDGKSDHLKDQSEREWLVESKGRREEN